MSMRYPGGFIASTPVTAGYPSGVWTQAQAIPYQAQNVWTRDQYWPYTTLLLQGNGTNGAQNNTFLDSSSNNFTITRNGNTTQGSFTPYEANGYWSNYFDGNGDYLTLPTGQTPLALGNSDFTIEAWVYRAASGNARIFNGQADFATPAGSSYQLLIADSGGAASEVYIGSASYSVTSPNPPLNTWSHIAMVRTGGTLSTYLNGSRVGTRSDLGTGSINTGSTSYAPSIGAGMSGSSAPFTGYISNLRVIKGSGGYDATQTTLTVPSAPLTAITNTSLLTCQSNRFIDNSTNAFAITRNGDASVQAFQPFPGATTYSGTVLGGSVYFDGTGDFLVAPSNAVFATGTGSFTIEGWIYRTGATFGSVLSTWRNDTGDGVLLGVNTSGAIEFYVGNASGGGFNGVTTTTTVPIGSWAHVAGVRNGSTMTVYINGVNSGTTTTTKSLTQQVPYIGAFYVNATGSNLFTGYLSNIRFVTSAVYTADFTPPTSPVTAITNTSLLLNFTNAGIFDAAVMNDLETVGNAQVSTSVVKYGTGSMAFDGSGDYLQLPSGNQIYNLSSGDWTVECWVYFNTFTTTTTPHLWTIGTNTDNRFSVYRESSGGKLSFVTANAGSYTFANGTTTVATGTWYHVAVVRNNGVSRLYVNGVQEASSTTAINSGTSVFVGFLGYGSAAADYLNGYIDDLRITKGVARYLTSFTPPPARMPGQ